MKEQLKTLNSRLENLIDSAFDVLVKIQELEAEVGPSEHLSNITKTEAGMIFHSILMRNLWDKMEKGNLTQEQRIKIVTEVGEATCEHYLQLYDYDNKEIANNS